VAHEPYPVQFSVDYPNRELNRATSAFRLIMIIPMWFLLGTFANTFLIESSYNQYGSTISFGAWLGGLIFLPTVLMLLFRKKYPRWWFDWNLEFQRFASRVSVYLLLMDDNYPSTDEHQAVHLDYAYPDAQRDLSRGLPLVKWFLAIPHFVVLFILYVGGFFASIGAWFAILFTGEYPRGIFDFLVGVGRWHNRVVGYAVSLVTDKYPPFRFEP
jgi:uncharacterized protein DUF4389